jgi:hypothetical protein
VHRIKYLLRRRVPTLPTFVDVSDTVDFSWIEPLQHTIETHMTLAETNTVWVVDTKVCHARALTFEACAQTRDNGVVGLGLCLRKEQGKHNRIRTLFDMSLQSSTPPLSLHECDQIIAHNLHANQYRDGGWGAHVRISVADGLCDNTQYIPIGL